MTTIFLVTWVYWTCPGGIFGGLVPDKLRPLVCHADAGAEVFQDSDKAEARIKTLGPDASPQYYAIYDGRLTPQSVTWTQTVSFK